MDCGDGYMDRVRSCASRQLSILDDTERQLFNRRHDRQARNAGDYSHTTLSGLSVTATPLCEDELRNEQ